MPSYKLNSFLLALLLSLTTICHARSCPPVWTKVAADLRSSFAGCPSEARQAMRAAFHDCFPGSCDGSLILANECIDREENLQMQPICEILGEKAIAYNVSTADMIQAAAAFGVAACGGPKIYFFVGRKDSAEPNPENTLPTQDSDAASQITAFKKKGFTATDLVALVGAHSAGQSIQELSFDSTPEKLDSTVFYPETFQEMTPTSLGSDVALSNSRETKNIWKGFGASQTRWNSAFKLAMTKMSIMGNDLGKLTDCSKLVS
ncbi:Manganese peroxidase 3 [Colletotrichum tanaceti]|uniref:Peroxidase n=1 Tax=Colletotrichum tanaceti TaxID=1306861 RepID=A0A4U6XGP7_9PEZI|nr:Manganese peroxidase 3 [Colletotrichum tanaceti]TKW54881.1 Manganese peroxidase 3 [Colletotrichum tanaceti]